MVRNRVIYLVVIAAAVGFSMAYMGKATHLLVFIVLLYPPVALALTAVQLALARAEFINPWITNRKNTEFHLGIRLLNRFIIPSVPMELLCVVPDAEYGLFTEKRLFVSLASFGKGEVFVKCRHTFRGSYTSVIRRIYVTDPLRIIRLSKKCSASVSITFLPRTLYMEDLMSRSAVEQSISQRQLRSADKEDFSHVRDYRDGDIMQMVHWKLTAKQDDIMIKQFDSVNDLRATVLCDYNCDSSFEGMTKADMLIETSLAFAKAALDRGISSKVDFGALNEHVPPALINDVGSWNRFYELMTVLPAELETRDFASMINSVDTTKAAILVLITDDLSQELLEQARSAATQVTVFYAYLNLAEEELPEDLSDERFFFLNIKGTNEDALNTAVETVLLDA